MVLEKSYKNGAMFCYMWLKNTASSPGVAKPAAVVKLQEAPSWPVVVERHNAGGVEKRASFFGALKMTVQRSCDAVSREYTWKIKKYLGLHIWMRTFK